MSQQQEQALLRVVPRGDLRKRVLHSLFSVTGHVGGFSRSLKVPLFPFLASPSGTLRLMSFSFISHMCTVDRRHAMQVQFPWPSTSAMSSRFGFCDTA